MTNIDDFEPETSSTPGDCRICGQTTWYSFLGPVCRGTSILLRIEDATVRYAAGLDVDGNVDLLRIEKEAARFGAKLLADVQQTYFLPLTTCQTQPLGPQHSDR